MMTVLYSERSRNVHLSVDIQMTFSGPNTDGSFTTAVSNSCLGLLEKIP